MFLVFDFRMDLLGAKIKNSKNIIVWGTLFQICFCSATGASFCYLLSYLVGRRLVHKYLPERAADWSRKVDKHKNNILSYIIFLRSVGQSEAFKLFVMKQFHINKGQNVFVIDSLV